MEHLVVLLRGINVGRNKRIAMAPLRELLSENGYADVRTHLQSGNVLLRTACAPRAVEQDIARAIRERFGHDVPVISRTTRQLAAVVRADPLGDVADDGARTMVIFLSAAPAGAALHQLTSSDFGDERLAVRGRELFAWCPRGVHASPLMKAIASARPAPVATARNWNTVTKLAELGMAAEQARG